MTNRTRIAEKQLLHSSKIMEFIYRQAAASRIKIAQELNLKPASVTPLVNQLLECNKIIETGNEIRELKGSGRSRKIVNINADYSYAIGIEFTMKGLAFVVTNAVGDIQYKNYLPLNTFPIEDITDIIIEQVTSLLKKFNKKCCGIGFAIPGHYDPLSERIISNNQTWRFFKLNKIKKRFDLPIFLENNIECMALNEYLFNPTTTPERFLFIHVGPGLFCSFFDNKHIDHRDNFYIGEIGHTVVDIHGQVCECGKRGCLQTYISNSWLINSARYLFETSQNTVLKDLVDKASDIDLDVIINAYYLGDSYIIKKIESGITFLATAIANTLMIYDSDKILINSELLNKLKLTQQLKAQIQEQLQFMVFTTPLDIEVLPYHDFRGAHAACALAVYHGIILQSEIEKK